MDGYGVLGMAAGGLTLLFLVAAAIRLARPVCVRCDCERVGMFCSRCGKRQYRERERR
jgi:hypothetical protein